MVVMAGGLYASQSKEVAIYVDGEWAEGPELPFKLTDGKVIQSETSFLIVGGYSSDSGEYVGTILEFDPIGMGWIPREETLEVGRGRHYAVAVNRELFCTPP